MMLVAMAFKTRTASDLREQLRVPTVYVIPRPFPRFKLCPVPVRVCQAMSSTAGETPHRRVLDSPWWADVATGELPVEHTGN